MPRTPLFNVGLIGISGLVAGRITGTINADLTTQLKLSVMSIINFNIKSTTLGQGLGSLSWEIYSCQLQLISTW